jgi:hypothetical protein
MISKRFVAMGALTLLSVAAYAGSAPKELYGKSVTVAWSESLTGKFASEQFTRNVGRALEMNIYISTAGRPFARLIVTGTGGVSHQITAGGNVVHSHSSETAPGEAQSASKGSHVDFQGHSIVVYSQFQSGARQVAIDVDANHAAGCKAGVIIGRQAGNNVVRQSGRGPFEATSVQIGSVSCSIREGNVFGQ